jgi:hypothetical protein
MPFALGVKSVNASAGAIIVLWDQVSLFEDVPSMRALNYPPHITFAIYDAPEVTKEMAIAAMERATQGRSTIEITFNRIQAFDGPSLILWADPEPEEVLLEMHQKFIPRSALNSVGLITDRGTGCRIARSRRARLPPETQTRFRSRRNFAAEAASSSMLPIASRSSP